ncbi:hypothetical Protein YC6258_00818 [Gynuella sunshinyii YC6258]|uniref:Uncharacterized protein n=1 Tax=Gynuella sunshinyii YC6258 TaxID=1445510 RepID=A0A0C5VHN9_9GAMM|nr:hypothetical Protein YC6258_00818 [Gynuella sunshinyii YC6258]
MADYGFTGRVAYSASAHELQDASQVGTARFSIKPGTHAQVIRLPGQNWGNQHFYVQAFGVPYGEYQDFALGSQSRGLDSDNLSGVAENAYRPKRFVPVKVPVYDEEASLLQEQSYLIQKRQREEAGVSLDGMIKPSPLYKWYFRPEYQFSVYDFEMGSINLVQTDQNDPDIEHYIDIQDIPDPKITGSDILEVIYSLQGGVENTRLPSYADQTLILSIGQQEYSINLTENGAIRIDDLEYLNQLGSDDYLTISLYTNEDAGNILWDYAFGRNGLHAYYKISGTLTEMLPLPDKINLSDTEQGEKVRTLGGMRLKYRYQPPLKPSSNGISDEYVNVEKLEWSFDHAGWYCYVDGVRYDDILYPCHYYEANQVFTQTTTNPLPQTSLPADWSVWWEPAAGDANQQEALWRSNLDIIGRFQATLTGMDDSVERFVVKTRTIGPSSREDMKGWDVAMLEELLWQLGLSPQKGRAASGNEGARIKSNRNDNATTVTTKPCSGTTQERDQFIKGWVGCTNGRVATEGLVRRFQGRSFDENNLAGNQNSTGVDGWAGNDTYEQLYRVWRHYSSATASTSKSVFRLNDIPGAWWSITERLLDEGGEIPYLRATGYRLDATYTDEIHRAITANFPADAQGLTRADILKAWMQQESGGAFWGTNQKGYQATPYRINEGGGSEEKGSMGFNQIVWQRTYGPEHDCDSIRGYVTRGGVEVSNVNQYYPRDNLFSFVAAIADDACTYTRGLYNAYVSDSNRFYQTAITAPQRPFKYCYETRNHAATSSCARNHTTWRAFIDDHDSGLNLLGKGIIAYNHGTGDLAGLNYFSTRYMLKSDPASTSTSTNFDYWMKIKEKTQTMTGMSGYLPYVTYIWVGERGLDINGDGDTEDTLADDPRTEAEGDAVNEAQEPAWCFKYGEEEWISPGFTVPDPLDPNNRVPARFNDYRDRAENNEDFRIDCN